MVIPKDMRDALGVKEGDELLVLFLDGRVVLTRPAEFARATRGMMKGAWGRTRREIDAYLERERGSWR
jgi:AbrB family looped-hinge helix DNA binding protein